MKRTPLYDQHKKLWAKMVLFSGWEMPLSYTGVIEEHDSVRKAVGLFDISHMGRIDIIGSGAARLLHHVTTGPVKNLAVGGMQYALACDEQGGILDDLMIYRFGEKDFFVCANGSNAEKIVHWLKKQAAGIQDIDVINRTAELAQLAVQGPASRDLMEAVTDGELDTLKLRHCLETKVAGVSMRLSRSGYTGELGYELYLPKNDVHDVWEVLMKKGKVYGLKPCGLGCRDTLRLEMGYSLYGNEMDEATTPIEASLEIAVDFNKGDFMGREAMIRQKKEGVLRKRIGFTLLQSGVPRHGHKIFSEEKEIGVVTSGNHSPSLRKGIGMGYLDTSFSEVGREILIEIRDKMVPAVIVKPPFYKKSQK